MAWPLLGAAVILSVLAIVGSTLPVVAWSRTREGRFLLLAGGQLGLLVLGVTWAFGQVAANPPSYATAPLPVVILVAVVELLLVLGSLLPRRP